MVARRLVLIYGTNNTDVSTADVKLRRFSAAQWKQSKKLLNSGNRISQTFDESLNKKFAISNCGW